MRCLNAVFPHFIEDVQIARTDPHFTLDFSAAL